MGEDWLTRPAPRRGTKYTFVESILSMIEEFAVPLPHMQTSSARA